MGCQIDSSSYQVKASGLGKAVTFFAYGKKAANFTTPVFDALGAIIKMWRFKVWSIICAPMFFGLLILIYINEGVGTLIMSLTALAVPIVMKYENSILKAKGIDVTNGSPVGNFLAKILGVTIVCGALLLFYTMAHTIYTGEF